MIVVSDSSPIIAFAKIGRLDLLSKIFSKVHIPPAVKNEILEGAFDRERDEIEKALDDFILSKNNGRVPT
jgi:predicted nucleic acid-binding protein